MLKGSWDTNPLPIEEIAMGYRRICHVGRVALNQIASANAAIKSTNALVEQVNDALGTALPPVDPIPGAAIAGAINDFFSALCALGALAGIIALWWFLTVVRRH